MQLRQSWRRGALMSQRINQVHSAVQVLTQSSDTLFLLLGAIMVFYVCWFYFEVGTAKEATVSALVKILSTWVSAIAYFIGYWVKAWCALADAETLSQGNGYELVKFFFLMTFSPAAIPAIVSAVSQNVHVLYPTLLRHCLPKWIHLTRFLKASSGTVMALPRPEGQFVTDFMTFAGSVVVHACWRLDCNIAVYFLACVKAELCR